MGLPEIRQLTFRELAFYLRAAKTKAEALSGKSVDDDADGIDPVEENPVAGDRYTAAAERFVLDPRWEMK